MLSITNSEIFTCFFFVFQLFTLFICELTGFENRPKALGSKIYSTRDFYAVGSNNSIWKDKEDDKYVNFFRIYNHYIKTHEKPVFLSDNERNSLNVKIVKKKSKQESVYYSGCVNIIGSNTIYDSTTGTRFGIYDDLHMRWMLNLIKHLCANFVTTSENSVKTGDGDTPTDHPLKGTAVIIDNSPGNGMLTPFLLDWLTDLGPEIGKFLFVSTLDSRDMEEVLLDISNCSKVYEDKLNAEKYIVLNSLESKNIIFNDDEKKEFEKIKNKLKETCYTNLMSYKLRKNSKINRDCDNEYFFIGDALKHFYDDDVETIQDYCKKGTVKDVHYADVKTFYEEKKYAEIEINKYTALIINKVPYDILVDGNLDRKDGLFLNNHELKTRDYVSDLLKIEKNDSDVFKNFKNNLKDNFYKYRISRNPVLAAYANLKSNHNDGDGALGLSYGYTQETQEVAYDNEKEGEYYTLLLQNARYSCAQHAQRMSENVIDVILTASKDKDDKQFCHDLTNIEKYIKQLNKSMIRLWKILDLFMMNENVYSTIPCLTYSEMFSDGKNRNSIEEFLVSKIRYFLSPIGALFLWMDLLKCNDHGQVDLETKERLGSCYHKNPVKLDAKKLQDLNWQWWFIPSSSIESKDVNTNFIAIIISIFACRIDYLVSKNEKNKELVEQIKSSGIKNIPNNDILFCEDGLKIKISDNDKDIYIGLFLYIFIPCVFYLVWKSEHSEKSGDQEHEIWNALTEIAKRINDFLKPFLDEKIDNGDKNLTVKSELQNIKKQYKNIDVKQRTKIIIDKFVDVLWEKYSSFSDNRKRYRNAKVFCEIITRFHDFASDTACLLAIIGDVLTLKKSDIEKRNSSKEDIKKILGISRTDNTDNSGVVSFEVTNKTMCDKIFLKSKQFDLVGPDVLKTMFDNVMNHIVSDWGIFSNSKKENIEKPK